MTAIITITGIIGRDAESKVTPNGKGVTSFSVAVDQYEGPGKDKTTAWFNISAWGERWGWLSQHAVKGARVCVVGELRRRDYESAKGPGVALEISASSIDVFARVERDTARPAEQQRADGDDGVENEDIPF